MIAANPISVRATDAKGLTPLHIACEIDDVEFVSYLIEQGKEALVIYKILMGTILSIMPVLKASMMSWIAF